MRWIVVLVAVLLGVCAAQAQAANPPAPGAPGERHTWASADKHGFGTSTTRGSEVWFTLRSAELSEIYYPDLSTPSFRDLEFVVTDGKRFLDRETGPGVRSEVRPVPGSLAFRQTTWTSRWRLHKTWLTDPAGSTVLADVRFESRTRKPLRVYVIADPAPGDGGNDDRGTSTPSSLQAYDDTAASAVRAWPSLRETTSGYAGTASDPRERLEADRRLGRRYDATAAGNVVQAARTSLTGRRGGRHLTLAIGFGPDAGAADATARRSLGGGFGRAAWAYVRGWSQYLRSIARPPASVRHQKRLYEQSVMVLEASEDKRNPGASIASPSMPWVWGTLTLSGEEFSGPYHLVWPRDFYHVATAQQAAGDGAAATRLMDYLWRVQKPDGSWWQNTRVDGTEFWTSLQMDEVALPVVLAWWLGRRSADDWGHVRRAADFIVANGPETEQERWENQNGWSPNTIATEIAALVCAADIAREHGDTARAAQYEALADEWQESVEGWTATTNGPYSERSVLPAGHQGRRPGRRLGVQPRRQLPAARQGERDRRPELPRARPVRRQAARRPDDPELAGGRRPDPQARHAARARLVPVHLRRLRRDGKRRRLGHLPDRRAADLRPPVAAAGRGAGRVRVARRAQRHTAPADDGGRRERRPDAARAGLGRPPADGRARLRGRRGHARGDAAGVDARAVRAAGVVDRRGRAGRAALDRRLPLRLAALLKAALAEVDRVLDVGAIDRLAGRPGALEDRREAVEAGL